MDEDFKPANDKISISSIKVAQKINLAKVSLRLKPKSIATSAQSSLSLMI